MNQKNDRPTPPQSRQPYEPPAIVYEGQLTTRAGSRPGGKELVDPADLFGNAD